MAQLSLGAVGLIDALGFKHICQRHNPAAVADTLRQARRKALQMEKVLVRENQRVLRAAGRPPKISATAFSDTFYFTAVVPVARDREGALAAATGVVACGLSYIMRTTAQAQVPLVWRGVIAAGDCFIDPDDKVFIGPAVDEAADLYEQANGAFAWLAPSAARLNYPGWSGPWYNLLGDYDVPLKGGRSFRTKVVNPFVRISHETEAFEQIRRNSLKAMASDSLDVQIKRQNTEALFAHFEHLSREHLRRKERESQLAKEYRQRDRASE
jgi:hypothetical protein